MPEDEYFSLVKDNTQSKELYNGFMNILNFSATLMKSNLSRAQVDQNARIYQWNPDQYANEKSKVESQMTKSTHIFLSFFVPERKHDDLHKSGTKWKIFLDVAGRRYDGTATKMKILLSEAQSLYPHHTRWQTPYIVSFPVPTSLVDAGNAKLTITGPVTSSTVDF